MELENIKTLDWSKEIQAIKDRYGPDFYKDKKAIQEAARFWGAKAGEDGAIKALQTEYTFSAQPFRAEIGLARSGKRGWLLSLSAAAPLCGFGWVPSVWDTKSYHTRIDARMAGTLVICSYFNRLSEGPQREMQHKAYAEAIGLLEGEKAPELDLF